MAGCERLDDYLDDGLTAADRLAFEDHLTTCADCRQWIDEARSLERRLARAAAALAPPPGLRERVASRVRTAQRRRLILASVGGLAAAAAVLLAFALGLPRTPVPSFANGPSPAMVAAPSIELHFPDDVEAAPVRARDPGVTIYWIYPNPPRTAKHDASERPAEPLADSPSRSGS